MGQGCLSLGWTFGQPFKTKHIEKYWPLLPIVTLERIWVDYISVCDTQWSVNEKGGRETEVSAL